MKLKSFIVYQITNKLNGDVYIGCHVTKNPNDNYMGSGTNIGKAIKEFGRENFEKIILHNFKNVEDMLSKEREIVNEEFIKRKDTYNIILGGGKLNTLGNIVVKTKTGKTLLVSINNPRYLSGELKPINFGKVSVKDKNGNTFQIDKSDQRYLSGELVGCSKGTGKNKIVVKNKEGKHFLVSTNDSRYLSGELEFMWKNKKHSDKSKKLIGEKNSKHQSGSGNSQYGKCWIHNLKLKKSQLIKKELIEKFLNEGWQKGRKQIF